jgi:hypothetical protein
MNDIVRREVLQEDKIAWIAVRCTYSTYDVELIAGDLRMMQAIYTGVPVNTILQIHSLTEAVLQSQRRASSAIQNPKLFLTRSRDSQETCGEHGLSEWRNDDS